MTVLYLIVARGGSKRLPGKNFRTITGLPLVCWKALATRTKSCTRAILSTDSVTLAALATYYGVEVPFMRPPELATDTATTEDVVRHAIAWCEAHGRTYDAIMLLEPSSPFVRPEEYDTAVAIMEREGAQFVFGDVLYLFRWDYLKTRTDLYDAPRGRELMALPNYTGFDIDTVIDFEYAEWLVANGVVDTAWTH